VWRGGRGKGIGWDRESEWGKGSGEARKKGVGGDGRETREGEREDVGMWGGVGERVRSGWGSVWGKGLKRGEREGGGLRGGGGRGGR